MRNIERKMVSYILDTSGIPQTKLSGFPALKYNEFVNAGMPVENL